MKYRIIPKSDALWSDIWLDDFVAQVVDPVLVKYGYLSSPTVKEIGSPVMKELYLAQFHRSEVKVKN